MKQYVIDELRPEDYEKAQAYLDENFKDSAMDGIYWIPLDEEILDEVQKEHADCMPFCFAVEMVPHRISFELLVRTRKRMRCECMKYANETQRNWLVSVADSIFEKLEIKI